MKNIMPTTSLDKVIRQLRRSLPPPANSDLPDAYLLEQFLTSRDETAFAALVQRHGRLVMGVCNRILGNVHDSEDVFQAVFFILARKGKGVIKQEALSGWLYTVAFRTALEARAANLHRRKIEVQMADVPEPAYQPVMENHEWRAKLDLELSQLPIKYRTLVILCDLEGIPRKEVARQLKLNEGTLSSRLARARRMLANRLSKFGLTLSASAFAASLAHSAALAKLPGSLIWSTSKAATLVAAGHFGGVSVPAVGLMKGTMKMMFLAKLKTVIGTSVVALVLGVGGLIYNAEVGPRGAQAGDEPKSISELEKLRKENDLLKMNLKVTLEKIISQEEELKRLKGQGKAAALADFTSNGVLEIGHADTFIDTGKATLNQSKPVQKASDNANYVEKLFYASNVNAAVKAWEAAKDNESLEKALADLEKAISQIRAAKKKDRNSQNQKAGGN
jgi:RNA polymerase sigma factor (sigma-70 family)